MDFFERKIFWAKWRHETVQRRGEMLLWGWSVCPGWVASAAVVTRINGAHARKSCLKMSPPSSFLAGPASLEREPMFSPRFQSKPCALTAGSLGPPGPSVWSLGACLALALRGPKEALQWGLQTLPPW